MTTRPLRHCGGALPIAIGMAVGSCGDGSARPPQHVPSDYREQILADHPEGYWRLDERAATVAFDQTTNANRGSISRGVTLGYPGATSGDGDTAMFFDGSSGEIVVPTAPSLELGNGSLTLEAWVKFVGPQAGIVTILGKGRAGVQTEYGLVIVDGVPGYQSVAERYMSNASLPPGVWTHLAVAIANNATGTFYVNGVAAGTFASSTNHLVSRAHEPFTIAGQAGASARFVGGIDEPTIYSSPLTAEQLAAHVTLATRKGRR